jgi:hypothetical protein
MDTKKVADLLESLDKARSALDKLEYEASLLNLNGHQRQISVRVGESKRDICLTQIDYQRTYASIAIRGTEMVMLGVKKLYASWIDEAQQKVAAIEMAIRKHTGA